jgi:RNA polymerase sigma factor (TIGR02999 family)
MRPPSTISAGGPADAGSPDHATIDELMQLSYVELRRYARAILRGEQDATRPTSLVHRAWQKLAHRREPFRDTRHFINAAAKKMRQLVIDDARRRGAQKRGDGERPVPLIDEAGPSTISDPELLLDIDRAIAELSPDDQQLVELHWYAGFTHMETGGVMGLSAVQAKERWATVSKKLALKLARYRARQE